jgi:phage shock protein E
MTYLALLLGILGLLGALAALQRGASLARRLDDLQSESGRRASHLGAEVEQALENLRRLLAAVAAGDRLTREQILEGRLWREIDGAEGRRLLQERGARLLDVRTPGETRTGVLPGALQVPVDELPARLAELPRDGRPTIVYCAMGSRSAYACELLSSEGFENLFNLEGGIGAWGGALERPAAG